MLSSSCTLQPLSTGRISPVHATMTPHSAYMNKTSYFGSNLMNHVPMHGRRAGMFYPFYSANIFFGAVDGFSECL